MAPVFGQFKMAQYSTVHRADVQRINLHIVTNVISMECHSDRKASCALLTWYARSCIPMFGVPLRTLHSDIECVVNITRSYRLWRSRYDK